MLLVRFLDHMRLFQKRKIESNHAHHPVAPEAEFAAASAVGDSTVDSSEDEFVPSIIFEDQLFAVILKDKLVSIQMTAEDTDEEQ